MPYSLPKPAPLIKDNDIRQAIEPLYLAWYANEAEINAALDASVAAVEAATATLEAATATLEEATGYKDEDGVATEEATASGSFVDLSTAGPTVTVEVDDPSDLVLVAASVELKTTAGAAQYGVYEATDYPSTELLVSSTAAGFTVVRSSVTPLPSSTGTRTFSLKYAVTGGGTATFKNRKLWAWTVGGFTS